MSCQAQLVLGQKQNHVDKSHHLMKTMTHGQKLHKKKQSAEFTETLTVMDFLPENHQQPERKN